MVIHSIMSMPLSDQEIGFVGLGKMGLPMARHLYEAGADVTVWNRSSGPLERSVALGLSPAGSVQQLGEAVGNGIVCLSLADTDAIESVVFGENGLVSKLSPHALIIDFSTADVPSTRSFAARHPHWLDAPVSGGQVGAEAADLTIMAGGDGGDFERALPLLEIVGRNITHLGPAGSGQVTKLVNQLIVAQTIDAVAQALRLAELAGLDTAKVREALLGGFAESRILDLHGDRMVRRDFTPGGRAALHLKDIRLICKLADSLGFASPTLENTLTQWKQLVESQGHGDLDHSAFFKLYE